jgi:surface antigen
MLSNIPVDTAGTLFAGALVFAIIMVGVNLATKVGVHLATKAPRRQQMAGFTYRGLDSAPQGSRSRWRLTGKESGCASSRLLHCDSAIQG